MLPRISRSHRPTAPSIASGVEPMVKVPRGTLTLPRGASRRTTMPPTRPLTAAGSSPAHQASAECGRSAAAWAGARESATTTSQRRTAGKANDALPWRPTSSGSPREHAERVFDEAPELGEERRADSTIDHAVIAGQGQRQPLAGHDGPLGDDGRVTHLAHGEDRPLRRIDDGREVVDAEHPEVRDRERAVRHLLGLELLRARPAAELAHFSRD